MVEPTVEERELLDRYARETAPTRSAVEQALTRTLVRIESNRRTANLPGERRLVWFAAAALAVVVIATGAFASGRWLRARAHAVETTHDAARFDQVDAGVEKNAPTLEPTPAQIAPVESEVDEPPAPIVLDVASPPAADVDVSKPRNRNRRPAVQPDTSGSVEPPVADAGMLAEESRLLAHVRRALRDDDFEAALAWAEEHAHRHPQGVLTEERLVLEAVAACRGGQRERGLAAAKQLHEQFPGSPTITKVEQACKP
jgi:hypothetical protein